jgi:hypothetical protein
MSEGYNRATLDDAGNVRLAVCIFVGFAQIPVQQEVFPLGIANNAFPVPAELRVVRGKEQ